MYIILVLLFFFSLFFSLFYLFFFSLFFFLFKNLSNYFNCIKLLFISQKISAKKNIIFFLIDFKNLPKLEMVLYINIVNIMILI